MEYMMKKTILPTLLLSLLPLSVQASDFYVGAEYAPISVDSTRLDALILTGGIRINDWLSVESKLGQSDTDKDSDGDDIQLDSLLAVHAKFSGRNNKSEISPYVLLGYARSEVKFPNDPEFNGSDSDYSYGLGLDFGINEHMYIDAEYINYYDENGVDITAYSLGFNYKF